jgi:hypothetical protein
MRAMSIAAGLCVVLLSTSCGGGGASTFPTGKEIDQSLEDELKSVAGEWIGVANTQNTIQLNFTLQEGSNGQVSGTGTMKEGNAAAAVPVTVSGTFQRPVLTLTFNGMVYESNQVTGTIQGSYVTVGGVAATMKLTGPGYTRDAAMLLQEK